ncbi:MAG: hypothetical protein R3F39_10085 [Myxococcota bacterium]
MSHQALQRVLVRLLYDPAFAAAAFADPDAALAEVALTPAERGWLRDADPRPFRLDPMRRTRTLKALLDEYPASLALVLHAGSQDLDAFFSSPAFHDAIQTRQALAPIFGRWLAALSAPHRRTAAVARLEAALSALRRPKTPGATSVPDHLALPERFALARLPEGTSALYAHVRAHLVALGPNPIEALYQTPPDLGRLPLPSPSATESLLLERLADGSFDISELPDALADLLAAAPASREALQAIARAHGAEPPEDAEVLDDLLSDGLLEPATQAE